MNAIPNRIVIYPKDIENITGRKPRTARKMLSQIKKKHKKTKSDFVTIDEFCAYTGFKEERVLPFLI